MLRSNQQRQQQEEEEHRSAHSSSPSYGYTEHIEARPQQPTQMGCMLIPVIFAVWWFWTRRQAQNVVQKVLLLKSSPTNAAAAPADTSGSHPSQQQQEQKQKATQQQQQRQQAGGEDPFNTWQEVMDQDLHDQSLQYVRWVKSQPSVKSRVDDNSNNNNNNVAAAPPACEDPTNAHSSSVQKGDCDDTGVAGMRRKQRQRWRGRTMDASYSTPMLDRVASTPSPNPNNNFADSGSGGGWQQQKEHRCYHLREVETGVEMCWMGPSNSSQQSQNRENTDKTKTNRGSSDNKTATSADASGVVV